MTSDLAAPRIAVMFARGTRYLVSAAPWRAIPTFAPRLEMLSARDRFNVFRLSPLRGMPAPTPVWRDGWRARPLATVRLAGQRATGR